MKDRIKLEDFAETVAKIMKKDRWVLLVDDGDMGEGKSCFSTQLCREVAKLTGTPFSYENNMTFSRKELKTWIDGDEKGENQMQEYSSLLADEIISLFFKRNWFDSEQSAGIELLNKCRDRHLFIAGNLPNVWDLDSAIFSVITFRIRIHERGRAWVFSKSRNPFTKDPWNRSLNEKNYEKRQNPYACRGFVAEVLFDDWDEDDKEEYYEVRNRKRKNTENQTEKKERYVEIKEQRNNTIIALKRSNPKITNAEIADIVGLDASYVTKIVNGTIR